MKENKIEKILLIIIGTILIVASLTIGAIALFKEKDSTRHNDSKNDTLIKVPISKSFISDGRQVTLEDIGLVEVNSEYLEKIDVYQSSDELIGKYVDVRNPIPEGGLFFKANIVNKEGNTVFSLDVDYQRTYGNSILPDDIIDIYFRDQNDDGVIYGAIAKNVRVIGLRDSEGNDAFSSNDKKEPSKLLVEIENDLYDLLSKASQIPKAELIPIPKNKVDVSDNAQSFTFLKDYILSNLK